MEVSFDLSKVFVRPDGSYVVNQGLYHVPNEGEYAFLWRHVDAFVKEHPEVLFSEEPQTLFEPTEEELLERYQGLVQGWLDKFAQTRAYDGIQSAVSYVASTDPIFAAEASYCVVLRDQTWRTAYNILAEVQAGTRALPEDNELYALLPVSTAEWPTANPQAEAAASL